MTSEPHWRKRETKMIDVARIKIVDRIIAPSKARIAAMAKSLSSDLGQLHPILITRHLSAWRVVAGATRLMAADELGWDQIEATIIGADNDYEYKLIEIAENFARHDLSETERKRLRELDRELRAERLAHFARLAAGVAAGAEPPEKAKGGRGKKGGVRDAARKAGVPERTARRKLRQNEERRSLDEAGSPKKPEPATPPKPQCEPVPQPHATTPPAPVAAANQIRCPYCGGQGVVTPEDAERIPVGPQVDAAATRH